MRSLLIRLRAELAMALGRPTSPEADYLYEARAYISQRELAEQRGRLSLAKAPHPRLHTGL